MFEKFIKLLTNPGFLTAVFTLLAITTPALAPWIAINGVNFATSFSVVCTGLAVTFGYLTESPKSKDARLKGSVIMKKGEKDA